MGQRICEGLGASLKVDIQDIKLPKRARGEGKLHPGKRKLAWKLPPFKLERDSSVSMTQQLRMGFASAIESGYYKPGDVLPTLRDMREIFGVSMSIALDVVEYLVADGYVRPRPRLGTIVLSQSERSYLGHILIVVPGMISSYYGSAFANAFSEGMSEKGYSVSTLFLDSDNNGAAKLDRIDKALNKHVSLVVALMPSSDVTERLNSLAARFVVVGDGQCVLPYCVGYIKRERYGANEKLLSYCKEKQIKDIVQFIWVPATEEKPLLHGFEDSSISVKTVLFPSSHDTVTIGQVRRVGYNGFVKYYNDNAGVLPELIVVSDDVLATGVVAAIEHLRIDVPSNVKLLVLSHKGNEHCASIELATMQMNPFKNGRDAADEILMFLRDEKHEINLVLPPEFIPGESL